MKFSISVLLFRLLAKIVPPHKLVKFTPTMSQTELENAMREQIEKWNDKTIDQGIKDIKEGNYYGLENYISAMGSVGITLGKVLQWLEDEKFLREHKRKYHPGAKGD